MPRHLTLVGGTAAAASPTRLISTPGPGGIGLQLGFAFDDLPAPDPAAQPVDASGLPAALVDRPGDGHELITAMDGQLELLLAGLSGSERRRVAMSAYLDEDGVMCARRLTLV